MLQRVSRPVPNTVQLYPLSQRLQDIDNDKLGELHMRLNILLQIPVKRLKQKKGSSKHLIPQTQKDDRYVWATPAMILHFLQNTIELCTPAPIDDAETPGGTSRAAQ